MTLQDASERLEFLKRRQAGIGGSDVGAIIGVDPWSNAYDVYLEKTREPTVDSAGNIHTIRGMVLEDVAADLYSEKTGRKVRRVKQRAHPDNEWAKVNVDRQILRSNGSPTGALEIKAPGVGWFARFLEEGAQEQHIVQLQWAMYVLGYEWGEFVAINLEHQQGPISHFALERNDDLIEYCVDVATRFWDHVEQRIPPTPDLWAYGYPPIEIPEAGKAQNLIKYGDDRAWDDAYQYALAAYQDLKAAEEEYEHAKERVLELAGDQRIKVAGDLGSVSCYWGKGRSNFDDTLLGEAAPLDLDKVFNFMNLRGVHVAPATLQAECSLDLAPFKRPGNPYQAVRVTPKKGASE